MRLPHLLKSRIYFLLLHRGSAVRSNYLIIIVVRNMVNMRKIATLTVFLLMMMFGGNAQYLLQEGFETGALPTGWTALDSDGDGYTWDATYLYQNTDAAHTGNGMIASSSWMESIGPLTPDNWLISPAVSLTTNATLTFWVCAQDANYAEEHYGVYISTNGGTSPSDFVLLYEETMDADGGAKSQGAWKQKSVNLSNYIGQTVRIAWRHFNCSDMFYLNLDDVEIVLNPDECSPIASFPWSLAISEDIPVCWNLISSHDTTWTVYNYGVNYLSCLGSYNYKTEQLETNVFDFSQCELPFMTFDFMSNYNYVSAGYVDLKVYVSTDGGNSYSDVPIWSMSQQDYFDAWTITPGRLFLNSLAGESSVKFKFSYEGRLCQVLFTNLTIYDSPAYQNIIYVKEIATGEQNGSSWDNAMSDLQEAMHLASLLDSVQVWVAAGTYYGDVTATNAFTLYNGVSIYGGFAGNEPADYDLSLRDFTTNVTRLDGQNSRRVLYNNNYSTADIVIDGFCIQNGYVNGSGGGAYLYRNAIVRNCTFVGNVSNGGDEGGGVYVYSNSSFVNCVFTDNKALSGTGGGACAGWEESVNFINCLFKNNSSNQGGGAKGGNFRNCEVSGNIGGGLYNVRNVFNCDIVGNTRISGNGAGVNYCYGEMKNSVVWGNKTNGQSNNLYDCSWMTISNCAIENDWNTESAFIELSGFNYGSSDGVAYPFFVSPESGDYRLRSGSALINAGSNSVILSTTDLAGESRVYDDVVDIGCYEYHGEEYCAAPVLLTVTDIIGGSAMVRWQNANPETPLYYELSYKMDVDSTWTIVSDIQTEYYLLTGLQPQTAYLVKVRLLCDTNDYTDYTPVVIFYTTCSDGELSVTIGESTNDNYGDLLPFSYYYPYSYTQQIYQAEEIGTPRIIDTLALQYYSNYVQTKNVDIYLGHTQKDVFASNSDWVPLSNLTLVYSGTINFNNLGENYWYKIPLTTQFQYNGMDNLVVVFDDNTGSWTGNGYFYTHQTTGYSSMYLYASGTNYNPASPNNGSRTSYRNNIRLSGACEEGGCDKSNVSAVEVTDSSALLVCALGAGVEGYELEYRKVGVDGFTALSLTDSSYLLTGLLQNTQYEVRIRSLCGEESSQWKYAYFTTGVRMSDRLYVKVNGSGDGESWATANGDLNWAMETAGRIHDIYGSRPDIWVAGGTYYGNTASSNAFTLVDGISIYGGFAGNESADYDLSQRDFSAHATILDGQNSRRVVYQANHFHTLTVMDGFTLRNGYTTGYGGGAYLQGKMLLRNSKIIDNTANSGGGIYSIGYSSNIPNVIDLCTIVNNTSSSYGGGVYASSNTTVQNSTLSYNHTTGSSSYGGAIYQSNSNQIVSNCLISNNKSGYGGGLYGSGLIKNSTIVRNSASQSVGGITGSCNVYNSIVWGNQRNGGMDNAGTNVDFQYCAVEGGAPGVGVVTLLSEDLYDGAFYPKFVQPSLTAGYQDVTGFVDWHLQEGSVCVNRGNNTLVTDSTDMEGNIRVQHNRVDLGCYESAFDSVGLPEIGDILYVTETGAGSQDGSSWGNAMSSINDAIGLARMYGSDVWVAQGTYYGDMADAAFILADGVDLYGGFAGNEPADYDLSQRDFAANPTILDGQNSRRVVYQGNSFNVPTALDGFTIQNGYASGNNGGGAYLQHNVVLSNCRFAHNTAQYGGGLYYEGNYYYYYDNRDTIRNCVFEYNQSGSSGGGIYNYGANIFNCLVANNSSSSNAGGIFLSDYGMITNSTIVRNTSNGGAGVYGYYSSTINNCVIWGNRQNGVANNLSGSPACNYSAVEGGYSNGSNVINLASENFGSTEGKYYPWFVAPDAGDFRLRWRSSLVNAGTGSVYLCSKDLSGEERVYGDTVDIGCYEYHGEIYCLAPSPVTVSDITGSSAMVTWQNPYIGELPYNELSYKSAEDSEWTVVDSIHLEYYMLSGLQPQTSYSVRIRTLCDTDFVSEYSNTVDFSTACPDEIPAVSVVGSSTTTSYGQYLPVYTYYPYSYTQQIYQAAELGRDRIIDTLSFQYYSNYVEERTVNIYLGHTQKTTFANTSDWVPLSNLTLVYSGSVSFNNLGEDYWFKIPLTTPFEYNGSDNLVVAFDDNTGYYGNSGNKFYTHSISNYPSMYLYSSGTNYNPASLPSGSRTSYRNNLRLPTACLEEGCDRSNVSVIEVTDSSARLVYLPGNGVQGYELEYKEVGSAEYTALPDTGTTCVLQGLRQNTSYEVRIRSLCGVGESQWKYATFTTEVKNCNRLYVKTGGNGSADSWTNANGDLNWAIETASRIRNTFGTLPDVWVAEGTYYGNSTTNSAFTLRDGISVYGGFAGNEPEDYDLAQRDFSANVTVLDGQNNRRVIYQETSFNVRTVLDGFVIQNGYSTGYGGGAYLRNNTLLSNCRIAHNSSTYYGGGLYHAGGSNDTILNCVFENNQAGNYGGGLYASSVKIYNCLIVENSSNYSGGGVYMGYDGEITNSTVVRNTSNEYGGGIYSDYSTIVNCVVWGNRLVGTINNLSGYFTCSYSAVEGGYSDGTEIINLSSDNSGTDSNMNYPWFVFPDGRDYRLRSQSCLINAGTTSVYLPNTDLSGEVRVFDDTVDIGCYEFFNEAYCLSPVSLDVRDITSNAAFVTWQYSELDTVLYYELSFRSTEGSEWTTLSPIYTEYFMLSDLQPQTAYTVRVRAVCDTSNFSYWSENVSFTTRCNNSGTPVVIGETTTTAYGYRIPMDLYSNYSYNQQIYLASEVGTARVIDFLSFQYFYNAVQTRNVEIYLGHTQKTVFSGTSDWVPASDLTLVYSGDLTLDNSGEGYWYKIPLQTVFNYNGTDNLVVVFRDNTGSYLNGYNKFYTHTTSGNSALFAYSSDGAFNPSSPGTGTLISYRSNLLLPGLCSEDSCYVSNVSVLEVTDSSAQIVCVAGSGAEGYELEYKDVQSDVFTTLSGAENAYLLTNLQQNTRYVVRIRSLCSTGSNQWTYAYFTTGVRNYPRLYVKTGGNGDGGSWETACNDLNWALNTASRIRAAYNTQPDIWVAAGTYYGEELGYQAFIMVEGVNVYGGFAGDEPYDYDLSQRDFEANATILDGANQHRVICQINDFTAGTAVVWDGFTIQNGYLNWNGAGIFMQDYSTLQNCIVQNNTSYSSDASERYGAGIYAYGEYDYSGKPKIINCIIRNNEITGTTSGYGGGVHLSYATLINCLVTNNTASYGAGVRTNYSTTIANSTIVRNNSTNGAAGLYSSNAATVINSVIWGNRQGTSVSNIYGSSVSCSYSAVEGFSNGSYMINLSSDNYGFAYNMYYPWFVSPDNGDYRLHQRSCLINAGTSLSYIPDSDLDHGVRVYGDTIDIGCYEFRGEPCCLQPISLTVQDITGNAAMLTWINSDPDAVASYELSYKMEDDSEWTVVSSIPTDYYMLTGLQQQSSYTARVRKVCDTAFFSFYSNIVYFNTRCSSGTETLTIGETTSSDNGGYLPTNIFYCYSYTQQIYQQSEIGSPRYIDTLSFQYFYSTAQTRNIDIYLGHTNKTEFTSTSDWVPSSALTLVYSGNITFNNSGENYWFKIPLTTAFEYNGLDNLVVVFDDNTGSYTNSGNKFYTHPTSGASAMYVYSDGTNYNPASPTNATNMLSYRNNLRFSGGCDDDICGRTNVSAVEVTAHSAKLVCAEGVGAEGYELEFKELDSETYTALTAVDNVCLLTGLRQNTQYVARVRSLCGEGQSLWKYTYFTTGVVNYDKLYVTTTGDGDGDSWATSCSDLNWAANTAALIRNTYGTNPEIWVAAGTYYGNTSEANAFTLQDGIRVYGGFAGDEPADFDLSQRDFAANTTILDGQNSRRVIYQTNAFSLRAVLDGFTIQNGYTTGYGGGAYLRHNTMLSNCRFVHNIAQGSGGGLYYFGGYDTIRSCSFENNTSSNYGGGVYLDYVSAFNCLVANNTAVYGGGVCGSYSTISNFTVVRNKSTNSGGGLYASNSTTMVNSVLWGNKQNTTVSNIANSNYLSCSYSAVEGGMSGSGLLPLSASNDNSVLSPRFVKPSAIAGAADTTENVDWHLQSGSLCINKGDNGSVVDSFDMSRNLRIQQDTVDVGCYESEFYGVTLPVYGNIIYVTETGAGTKTGESWENAIPSIEDAQTLAVYNNAVVWVAAGVYNGDTTSINAFTMRDGVSVYGGFAGDEPANYDLSQRDFETNTTVLDGQNDRRVLYQPNSFTASTAVTWDGFTIQNGRVNDYGAGVYMRDYSSLQHCVVQYNAAYASSNSSYCYGGGVYVSSNNSSSVQIAYCKISYNAVEGAYYGYGGGLYTTYAKVHHTEISHNSSTYRGGGVYAYSSCTYSNCLIHNNTSSNGGGIYNYNSSNTYINCDIVNNDGRGIYCYSSPNFTNCIVWGNKLNYMVNNISGGNYSYCAVEEGVSSGTGNMTLASTNDGNDATQYYVRFNDPENEDFRLHPTSSCINVGNNASVTDSVDFYGNPRIYADIVDIGCSEAFVDETCPSVVNLAVSNVTTNSALLSWHAMGNETQWGVVYQELGGEQITVMVSDTFLTLTGLAFNRNYTAKVRAICDSGMMSIFSIPVYFQTDCDPNDLDTLSNFSSMLPVNNTIVYQNWISFSWSSIPEATSYDFYLWSASSNEPSTPTLHGLTVPSVYYSLPDYQPGREYYWKVVAWNECIYKSSEVQTLRVNKSPDLHVSQVTTSNPVAGQSLTVTWTVTNDGEGNTPPGVSWTDYIWISPVDGVGGGFWYNVSEVQLATIPNLTSLNAGESYQNSATVTIPEDMIGNYYLFVFADQPNVRDINYSPTGQTTAPDPYTPSADGNPYHYLSGTVFNFTNQVVELSGHEADNFFYKVITVLPPPSPDLVVNSIAHPTNTFSGNEVPFTWTVKNQGEAAAVGSWYDAVYISEDTVLNTDSDLRLGRFLHEGTLLIDSSYSRTEQLTIPIHYMGDYYFFVLTDCLDGIYEGLYEQNNMGVSANPLSVTLTPPADLTVSSITIADTLDANAQYQCTYTVKNIGSSNTYGNSWRDAIYLSRTSDFISDSARWVKTSYHSGVLSPDSTYSVSVTFTVPSDISGLWYLYVSTDDNNQIFEYNLEDNNIVKRMPVLVVNIPDLTVSNIDVPDTVDPNGTIRVDWTVRNNGPGNAVNRTFRDQFLYNGQMVYNVVLYNVNLAAGDSVTRTAVLQIPCQVSDSSQLTITTDSQQTIRENNENNNSSTVSLNVMTPDLTVTSVTGPSVVWSGTLLPEATVSRDGLAGVSYKIRNSGTVPVIDKMVTDRIYFSTSPDSFQESDSLVSFTHPITLAPNAVRAFTCQVPIPNGISGSYYYHVVCDVNDDICEGSNTAGNVGHSTVTTVNLSPWVDLVLTQVQVQDTTYIGATFPVTYTIRNEGTALLDHVGVCQKFYYSTSPNSYNVNDLLLVKNDNLYLAVGAEVTNVAYMAVPSTQMQRYYYIHVVTDATNLVYEYTGENNNKLASNRFFAKNYQLDLAAVEIDGPDEVQWGQTATYRLHVSNVSSLPTLASLWQDALYLSDDPILNSADLLQQMVYHNTTLGAGEDYWADFSVTIPYGTPATAYLLGYADINSYNPDVNHSNNSAVKMLSVSSVPTPDLAVTAASVLDEVVCGQPARLVYTVENVGELDISMLTWNDRLFLSLDNAYQSTDLQLQTRYWSNMSLAVGESYTDTLTFTVPLSYQGGLYVLAIANSSNQPYEMVRSNNMEAVLVNAILPPPGDLIVTDVASEDSIVSGQVLHATWKVRNIGDNSLSGNGLRTLVYVSTDTVFDANDRLLGSVTTSISLAVDAVKTQSLNARISGLAERDYYLIVKTDVTNAFNEVDDNNNMGYSAVPFNVKVRPLPFNTDVPDTLRNDEVSDFKITVGDEIGQTVRIHLSSEDSLAGAVNMIYATHNDIGNNLNYSYSTIGQYSANPELYIPSTQMGYYGVNVYGSTPVGNTQNTVIRADILPFELRAIDANYGGNTGSVTVELTGSHFRPDMELCLRNENDTIYPDSLIYVNYYQAFATFNLLGKTPGLYDVSVVNFCEGEAVLSDGFEIQNGLPNGLSYNLIFPSAPRVNRNIVMLLEFGNVGNVDLTNQVLEVTSVGGMPISLTPEGVSQQQTTILVPLSIEGEPQGLLRPGSYGTVNIYGYTSSGLVFSIKPVEE